ncbi:MAG: hypothetical protein HGA95_04370 [Caldiserica bacterium]|nr:hypothetical protein [Caldisericota bacterium]
MKMIGFDIEAGKINWERKLCWHNGPYACNAESIELVDSNSKTVECIITENVDSKNKVVSFINIDSGETLATFDNKGALEIKAIKVYYDSISLICDSAIIVGRIDHSIKKLMIICKMEFNNNGLINNHNPPENDYTPSSYYIVKDMAVYSDNKKTYIYNIETLDKVTVLDDVSFNNYAYSGNTFYLWNSSKAEKIEIK